MFRANPEKNSYQDVSTNDLAASTYSKVEVRPAKIGQGVFAVRDIAAGEPLLEFTGPIINFDQSVAKGEKMGNVLQIDHDAYIDIDMIPESPAPYVNHSCNPNAGIIGDRILIALRQITAGEEIFFDYSTTMDEDFWTMKCLCGTQDCRGTVTDFKYLPSETKQLYLKLGIVQKFIVNSLNKD
ncbi:MULTISPECIES: SET domain-containing protein-lysine N-methyltransferase [unclassified Moorena]|uniref:SET domain-containing protein n=1 Tax=unclassified Moorena TaxID=2683338 RepID=UPI00140169DF|nr:MULTISPECIES: SET domain-containing protein-lysine N-methyltransferase [unclassified Moorena]NEO15888.1 SET domain-containing protein [Moorena sp. SIO3E8]NEQ02305.1 SET domain-containing protein [Moorena sp. SIO3F7]